VPHNQPSRLDIALKHAGRGWKVFPLFSPTPEGKCTCSRPDCKHPGKHPRVGSKDGPGWQDLATTDSTVIKAWWKKWPDANIGIATGKASGLAVLDVDGPAGEDVVKKMGVPKTCTVRTGKGRQLYLKHPGFVIKNKVKVFPDLDSRGDGGYVVAPGSLHASGKVYYFEEGLSPEAAPPAAIPRWWLDVVRDGGVKSNDKAKKGPVKEGGRNSHLASLAGSLRDKGLSAEAIEVALLDFNKRHCQPPLDDDEVKGIAASYGRYEEGDPHRQLRLYELAKSLMHQEHFICSPIDQDGRGVVLMVYRDGSYKNFGASVARSMALRGLGNAARPETINSTVELIKEETKKDDTLLNPKALKYVNVMNGMLDWEAGDLVSHDPTFLSSIQMPVEWRPDAKSPLLDKFLSDVFPEDALQLAEEIIGYFMLPTTVFQKSVMLVGEGANGKSTFLNLVNAFLGRENISRISLHSLEESPFSAAELQGKLLNIYADLAATKLEKVEVFKHLVGGDPISAQRKYGQPFVLHSFARLLFSANAFPRSEDTSEAYMRRWIVIPFPRRFEGKDRDPHLTDKITKPEVLSALLVRAVTGLRRLMVQGEFSKCASTEAKVEEYKTENDSAYEFAQETLKAAARDRRLSKREVWEGYEKWCEANGIKFPMAPRRFNHQLAMHLRCHAGVAKVHGVSTKVWEGLQWAQAPVAAQGEKF
jgi:P4 family phage/plasmid primase-like protien